jgi:hypothetical protein
VWNQLWVGKSDRECRFGTNRSELRLQHDGVNDTATASFTVASADSSVNLSIDMLAAVRRPAYVVVRYRITNNASSAISFKLYRAWDLDIYWDRDYENDEVCGGVYGGQGYPSQGEVGDPALRFALSSLNPINGYVAAKRTFRDLSWPPDCPTMGYGTDFQEWDAYGIPSCWVKLCRLLWSWTRL